MIITKRLQKLSAMIISNSNYQLDWLDWIANMKKTFQFYKAKADSPTAINQQSLQTEDCTENNNILAAAYSL